MSDDHDYTSSSSSSRIQLLNDSNFSTWKSTMEAVLKEKKFYKYVSGGIIIDSKNREDDQAVQGFIMARVEPIQRDLVVDKINATAKETWDLICAHHEKGGPQATMLAIGELVRLAYNEGDDKRAQHQCG
jgi:hypothetical protein